MLLDKSMMCDEFESFCKTTAKYPVASMKFASEKEERRIAGVCESLYALSNTLLPDMRNAYREMRVDYMFDKNIIHEYLAGSIARFAAYFEFSVKTLSAMCNKEPLLKQYYKDNYGDGLLELSATIFDKMRTDTNGDQQCVEMYKSEFKKTMQNLKNRYN